MRKDTANQFGFTLIELVLVISLIGVLLAISTVTLFRPVSKTDLATTTTDIFSLLREAQNKAINTDTSGEAQSNNYGVHFEAGSYTLFKGTSYVVGDPSNLVINTPSNIAISPNLPCSSPPGDCNNIVFQRVSGEVLSFDDANDSVCITETATNNQSLLTVSFIGVVDVQEGC
jgi:prepilin-type N-terminal cleavage/methylation domain-containing protein